MGIDVYLHWKNQTEAERKRQITGYSTQHGHVGYLREAYHGGPYATAYLITENWDKQPEDGFAIPAAELKKRLPSTVLATIYRHHVIYGEQLDDPSIISDKDAPGGDACVAVASRLAQIFADMPNVQNRDYAPNDEQVRAVTQLIEKRQLPDYALAFVDFVKLAKQKEKETGEPCLVYVSH